jgi:hypothetical protein
MIARVAIAAVYGIIVALLCLLGGGIIASLGSGPFDTVGHFLVTYAWVLGFLAFVLAFFGGASLPHR